MNIDETLQNYKTHLQDEQLGQNTINIYLREIRALENYLKDTEKEKIDYINYIESLKNAKVKTKKSGIQPKYKLSTLNNKIIAINKYLKYTGDTDKLLKEYKTQSDENLNTMSDNDFKRLLKQAKTKGTDRDVLMLLVFYYTGLRVSELSYFTVESVKRGYMEVTNKGKTRIVGVPKTLVKIAKKYIADNDIKTGSIILNKNNEPLSRNYIFKRTKYLGGQARLPLDKVYPHSIRHLFAKNMVQKHNINPLQLADILGHESISTTRQYSRLNIEEVKKLMDF